MPSPVLLILLLTLAVSSYALYGSGNWFDKLLFNAWSIEHRKQYYRFVTYGFVHADLFHLAVNMYVLWMFGGVIQDSFIMMKGPAGLWLFILLYVGGLIMSTFPAYLRHKDHVHYNAVGASGAVSAIVFAFIMLNPRMPMGIIFIPFYIPAWIFGGLYMVYSYFMAQRGSDRIGHDVHLFGALFGITFMMLTDRHILSHFFSELFS